MRGISPSVPRASQDHFDKTSAHAALRALTDALEALTVLAARTEIFKELTSAHDGHGAEGAHRPLTEAIRAFEALETLTARRR